jgi:hypothetical protein
MYFIKSDSNGVGAQRHAFVISANLIVGSAMIQRPQQPKLVQLVRALVGCTLLFCIPGFVLTFVAMSSTIDLVRVDQERVDATVEKRVLFIVPISTKTVADILSPESTVLDGGPIREGGSPASTTGKITGRAEDEGILTLSGQNGESIQVSVSPKDIIEASNDIHAFISEGGEPALSMWVVSNWKFGVIVPGALLLFCLVVFILSAGSILLGKR